nr:unnamed protein product [Naegleria fowleri]
MKRVRETQNAASSSTAADAQTTAGEQPKTKQAKTAATTPTQQPQQQQQNSTSVQDALAYLDLVKKTYANEPHVYSRFLEIMKEFKNHVIDTPGVIQKVSELFKNHSHLILGFNSFLPPGYKIVLENNEQSSMNAAENQQTSPTPSNASQSVVQGKKKKRSTSPPPVPAAASSKPTNDRSIDFDQAISYVTKIKKRFADSPHTYKAFLDILHNYQKEQTTIKKVYEQVSDLFKDHQDLLSEFAQFLPMPDQSKKSRKVKKSQQPQQQAVSAPTAISDDKKRRTARTTTKPKQHEDFEYEGKHLHNDSHNLHLHITRNFSFDETNTEPPRFFVQLRERLGDYEYNQILKCINMYTSDIIDRSSLLDMVSESEALRKNADLFKKLKKLISTNSIDESLLKREKVVPAETKSSVYGPSYRVLNKTYPEPICSERTELCNQVLNDEFVSVPAGSEESRDIQKKSQFDEIIFQCEDDRTELDIVIEQNESTIKFLAYYAEKIKNNEDFTFNYEDMKDIHRASINRIYAERGPEVLEGLRRNPAVAIPIVYRRLKQKDEEWKKARKELNRFWNDIYQKNFQKAMESQYNIFKQNEKKKLKPKEILREVKERHEYCRPLIFEFPDRQIHDDIYYLLINLTNDLTPEEVRDINMLWKDFLIPFLDLQSSDYVKSERFDAVLKEVPEGEQPNSTPTSYFTDLFKQADEPSGDGAEFPPIVEQQISKQENRYRNNVFYGNSFFMIFFRYYCALYEKLYRAKLASKRTARMRQKSVDTATILKEHDTLLEKSNFNNEKKEKEKEKVIEEMASKTNGGDHMEIDSDINKIADDIYSQFLVVMIKFLNGLGTSQSYDDDCRKLLDYDSYPVLTFDRVFVEFQKHVYAMMTDHRDACYEFLQLFKYEMQRVNRFIDNSYRLNAQKLVGDEVCYVLEYSKRSQKARIDEIDPPEVDLEKIEAEEKALCYVQEFLLSSPSPELAQKNKIFLQRNKKRGSNVDPHSIIIRNRLECKICIATFKLYFVEDTEDFLFRKSKKESQKSKQNRAQRWHKICEQLVEKIPRSSMENSTEQQPSSSAMETSND